jgi:hypothetical protein
MVMLVLNMQIPMAGKWLEFLWSHILHDVDHMSIRKLPDRPPIAAHGSDCGQSAPGFFQRSGASTVVGQAE